MWCEKEEEHRKLQINKVKRKNRLRKWKVEVQTEKKEIIEIRKVRK